MGMPISEYTVLKALGDKNAASYETNTALKALSPFNLFAFIIHDPETHREFARQISFLFDHLDFVTGHELLFFALVDPPPDWLTHAHHRPYYKTLTSWDHEHRHFSQDKVPIRETEELLNPENAIFSVDQSITAFSLANSIGIPAEDLPCIVVTADFRSERFLWFKTCPEHLEEQMTKLGYIAARRIPHESAGSLLEKVRRETLDLCNGQGEESLENSLAKALSDVLSFIIAGNSSDSWLRRQALEQAQETITRLYTALSNLKRNSQESEAEEMDKLCLNIVSFISQLNTKKDLKLDDFIPVSKEFLENDSYQILKTAHRVFNLLVSGQEGTKAALDLEDSLDFTPGIICLAKVFEKEANLSVVHWIRKELGISLPSYFNKPQPSIQAILTPQSSSGRRIDFNINRRGKWLPPGIGQSEIACKELSKTKIPKGWDKQKWDLLLDNWKVIREKRNEAAHIEMVDRSSLDVVKDSLVNLSLSKVFEKFHQMKAEFSGRA